MSKTISMHFTLDGDGFTKIVQQVYAYENREKAHELINSVNELTDEQKQLILEGEAALTGISVCDKKDCDQCKSIRGKNEMKYIVKQNQEQIKILYKQNIPTIKTSGKYVKIIVHVDKVEHTFNAKRALLDNYCNVMERGEDKIRLINARDIDPYKKQEYVTQVDYNKEAAHSRLIKDMGLEIENKYDQFGEKLDVAFLKYYVLYHTSDRESGFKRVDIIDVYGRKRDKVIVTGIGKDDKEKVEVYERD